VEDIMKTIVAFSASLAMALGGAAALAGPAWEFDTENINFTNDDWNFGNKFWANNFLATHLGYYDDGGNGFVSDHEVALYDGAGILLRAATVTNQNCVLIGHFCYTPISPILLNGEYWVHGTSGSDNYTWNTNGFFTDAAITYLGNTWAVNGGGGPVYLGFLVNDVADGYWGPNLYGGVIPEPAAWAMMIAGFGLVGFAARRRRTVAIA
jgi:hypothetical protein